ACSHLRSSRPSISRTLPAKIFFKSLEQARAGQYSWLEWDAKEFTGKMLNKPAREDIPENINEQLIVELYSK
ncbi:MAG: hypothetical protein U9Q83_03560, partial [Bacteroidota bacterium]|nr:hypothetical protein [Bacteroidota bacterium]